MKSLKIGFRKQLLFTRSEKFLPIIKYIKNYDGTKGLKFFKMIIIFYPYAKN